MTIEQFKADVEALIANLTALASASDAAAGELRHADYSIAACECAAQIGDFDVSMAKMFNREYREAVTGFFFDRAIKQARAA